MAGLRSGEGRVRRLGRRAFALRKGRGWRLACRAVALCAVVALALAVLRLAVPSPRPFAQLTFSRAFLDKDGRLLRLTAAPDGRYRLWTPLSAMAPTLIEATLAKEDRRFYLHPGVDPLSVARAAAGLFGVRRSGASTISMQLARLLWRLDTRSIAGKARQMVRAVGLELVWSKRDILEAYLNLAPYGGNVEGAGAAAWLYFGKAPKDLSRAESLRLALVPQSPAKRGHSLAKAARKRGALPALAPADLASATALANALLPADRAAAATLAADAMRLATIPRAANPWRAPHLVDRLRATLPPPAARVSGAVRTTIELPLQDLVERQLEQHLTALRRVGVANGAVLLVHRPTRSVRAYAGSADFADPAIDGQVDGIRARRSPGSTLKPLLYALALDQGLIHSASMLLDVPSGFGAYDPENFDHSFLGPVDATTALVASRNVPAIELLNRVGSDAFETFLRRGGVRFRYPAPGDPARKTATLPGLTLALGGSEVSMEELVGLYAALGEGGRWRPLRFLARDKAPEPEPILSPAAAFIARAMLTDNPRPNERVGNARRIAARASPLAVAWKTGTSFGMRDAWAVGLAGDWALAVWLGDFRGRPNAALVGRDAAGPLLFKIIDDLVAERPLETLASFPAAPARAKRVHVCALSGGLPGPGCGVTKDAWFIPGVSPAQFCPIHRVVELRAASGLQACGPGGPTFKKAFEFWPTDALRAFAHLGLPRRAPPAFEPNCPPSVAGLAARAAPGHDPGLRILSPRRNVVYPVPVTSARAPDPILLAARAAPDAGRIFWYLDETLLGATAPGDTLPWTPKPGRYTVRAVDAQGASDARDLLVVAIR